MKAAVALVLVLLSLLNRGGGSDHGFSPAQMMRRVAIERASATPLHAPIRSSPLGWIDQQRIAPEALRQVW